MSDPRPESGSTAGGAVGPDPDRDLVSRRAFERERRSRKAAERLLEERSRALFERTEDARRLAEELTEALEIRKRFVAGVSHEIRTPMTSIIGFTELLRTADELGLDAAARAEYVETIARNGKHLLAIIDEILDMSKIESGTLEVTPHEVDPAGVLEEVVQLLSVQADAAGLDLRLVHDSPLPTRIQSDAHRLRQVLLNVIGNAIKFTERGSVTVRAVYEPYADRLRIDVVDTGVGISEPDQARIFDRFYRVERTGGTRVSGTGLGLPIARHIAERLGGGIDLESTPGVGTTMRIRIGVTFDGGTLDAGEPEAREAA